MASGADWSATVPVAPSRLARLMQARTLALQSLSRPLMRMAVTASRIVAHDHKKTLNAKTGTKEDCVYLLRRPRRAHACRDSSDAGDACRQSIFRSGMDL